jgi:hypothetical protein
MKFHLDKFISVLRVLGPVVLSTVPGGQKIAPLIPTITGAIEEAEALPGATGAEKKAHVLAIVEAGVATANATGKVKLDPTEVAAIADKGIDTVVQTVKVVEKAHP